MVLLDEKLQLQAISVSVLCKRGAPVTIHEETIAVPQRGLYTEWYPKEAITGNGTVFIPGFRGGCKVTLQFPQHMFNQ